MTKPLFDHHALFNDLDVAPIKKKFARVICQQMSHRTLAILDQQELIEFIYILYDFFIIEHHQGSHIYLGKPQLSSSTLTNRQVLKISQPDAPHLFITIEEICRKHRLRLTRCIHPIIGIQRDASGAVVDIVPPNESLERRSLIFIAFEHALGDSVMATLKSDLDFHLAGVQHAKNDAKAIANAVSFVSHQLSLTQHPTSSDFKQLLAWMTDQNFSFFGAQVIHHQDGIVQESLGICNMDNLPFDDTASVAHPTDTPFVIDRISVLSPIQRFDPLMRVSFRFSTTQYIFYGVLKRSSMYAKNMDTPIINKKMAYIFNQRDFVVGSYNFNEVIRIFNDIPKFELFRTDKNDLLAMVDFILSITNLNHVQCFTNHGSDTTVQLYVVIPYSLFSSNAVTITSDYIRSLVPDTTHIDIIPITAPERCRIHIHLSATQPIHLPDDESMERALTPLIQSWADQCRIMLQQTHPHILKDDPHIIDKIPPHHRGRTTPDAAIRDLTCLLNLSDDQPMDMALFPFVYPPTSDLAGKASMLVLYHRRKLDLTDILPILHHFGLHIVDELTSRFGDAHSTIGYVLMFRLLNHARQPLDEARIRDRFIHALQAVFAGTLPNDPLNALILTTSLTTPDLMVLQALRNYMHQVTSSEHTLDTLNRVIMAHPSIAEGFIRLFLDAFDPDHSASHRTECMDRLTKTLSDQLEAVNDIVDDQLLRQLLSIIQACDRTNYFFKAPDDALSFKLNCAKILGLPTPVPYRETFVFDARLEGVHIRFGAIARGGLRWSHRVNDYRTEVLDLVKTQQTKNAVIIPSGAKGGFVIKTDSSDGKTQYRRFITAMLQLTDTLVDEQVVPHPRRIRHDGDDPYFVVAADKGTATFSDIANEVSEDQGFWLGDAFASGGQHGYDHKKVGITAKGAWECVKRHFASMTLDDTHRPWDPEQDPVTVVGIGDMSGDVFGNGMRLSRTIQLVAAFNHMHIFVDPNPDPEASANERERLFHLPHSTWQDYRGISEGGGVFDRFAKSIPCTPAMQTRLGITASTISGDDLVKVILTASVDLLWFGGIGTYIKSSRESHMDVGDPSNNTIRVNANDVRAKVIGEGANLGITQLGRIEYEHNQGRINTDAIDNSAGVNMSDYEVNIKILLSKLLANGTIQSMAERHAILESATDDVTALVLQNNVSQHQLISMDQYRSKQQPFLIDSTISDLIRLGQLNHIDEQIPTSKERQDWYRQSMPLPRSVLAKCQAYTKMRIKRELAHCPDFDTMLNENAIYTNYYRGYFPASIQALVSDQAAFPDHPLKKEIIITHVTNHLVKLYGCASYELLTAWGRIPIGYAVHHMVIINELFDHDDELAPLDDMATRFKWNGIRLQILLLCYVLGDDWVSSSIPLYKDRLAAIPSVDVIPALYGLFVSSFSLEDLNRFMAIEKDMGIMSQIQRLIDMTPTTMAAYEQKITLLIDLYDSLIALLKRMASGMAVQAICAKRPTVSSRYDTLTTASLYAHDIRRALQSFEH